MGSVGTAGLAGSMGSVCEEAGEEAGEEPQLYYPSPLAERSPGDPFQVGIAANMTAQ